MKRQRQQPTLEQRVLDFVQEHHLISGGEKLLVAVSGGPDSVCLLHILVELSKELAVKLHVAHLNHQLRGIESEADASYVSDLARQFGIPATIDRQDVKGYQTQQRLSLEEAAREVRYSFLTQVARSMGANRVAVGHTMDDHIETILMHLIRGTGTRGLRGLQPITVWQSAANSLTIVRPLLTVSHQETEDYCHHHRLMPRLDASNLSLSPLRNRIRHQLLPLLKSYNPRVVEALLRTGHIASDDIAFLDRTIAQLWDEIAQEQQDTIILDKERFDQLPSALQRYLLRASAEKLLGSAKDVETRHIEAMMSALTKPAGKKLNLPRGLIFSIEYNKYLLTLDFDSLSPFPMLEAEFPLRIPGKTLLPGWRIEATIISREQMSQKGEDFTAYFDLNKTGNKLVVRPRRSGDRFQPLGMSQPKKLGEFMIDAKIPQGWRQQVPIVCSPQQILWVVGWRIDDRVKVTDNTKRVLCLKFERG
ncbi:MAG: tRNA lysidine(34) synthetase TilS [Dehalococcoidia bacterium]|nr:tRNA lysidine(34) synthetase TilS [Dehalococcoidia bacterium]